VSSGVKPNTACRRGLPCRCTCASQGWWRGAQRAAVEGAASEVCAHARALLPVPLMAPPHRTSTPRARFPRHQQHPRCCTHART
jgi:hypothetical protein